MTDKQKASAPVSAEPVAYLDLGAGGYMDVGTDLTDEQLAALPKGRHMLAIVGTYSVEGFTAAPVAAQPDVTQQTLDDVMAGIPARDAEIEALRKEVEALQAAQAQQPVSSVDQFRDAAQMTAQQPATTVVKESLTVDERAAFEWWASDDGEYQKAIERSGHGYKLAQIQTYWMAWQARAELARQEEKQ